MLDIGVSVLGIAIGGILMPINLCLFWSRRDVHPINSLVPPLVAFIGFLCFALFVNISFFASHASGFPNVAYQWSTCVLSIAIACTGFGYCLLVLFVSKITEELLLFGGQTNPNNCNVLPHSPKPRKRNSLVSKSASSSGVVPEPQQPQPQSPKRDTQWQHGSLALGRDVSKDSSVTSSPASMERRASVSLHDPTGNDVQIRLRRALMGHQRRRSSVFKLIMVETDTLRWHNRAKLFSPVWLAMYSIITFCIVIIIPIITYARRSEDEGDDDDDENPILIATAIPLVGLHIIIGFLVARVVPLCQRYNMKKYLFMSTTLGVAFSFCLALHEIPVLRRTIQYALLILLLLLFCVNISYPLFVSYRKRSKDFHEQVEKRFGLRELSSVLENEHGFQMFLAFLVSEWSAENLILWTTVQRFKLAVQEFVAENGVRGLSVMSRKRRKRLSSLHIRSPLSEHHINVSNRLHDSERRISIPSAPLTLATTAAVTIHDTDSNSPSLQSLVKSPVPPPYSPSPSSRPRNVRRLTSMTARASIESPPEHQGWSPPLHLTPLTFDRENGVSLSQAHQQLLHSFSPERVKDRTFRFRRDEFSIIVDACEGIFATFMGPNATMEANLPYNIKADIEVRIICFTFIDM